MMEGVVNLRREATLRIVVGNSNRQLQAVDAVIDTGFNGFLSLPSTVIATLNLPWSGSDFVTLGDGSAAIPNSNGSVGYRIDFASVPQNRVNELPIGFCRNGSPRFEFYRDAELLPQGYRWHG